MARYIAHAYLAHRGRIVKTGEKLDLTDKQAERLGDKVTKLSEASEEQKAAAADFVALEKSHDPEEMETENIVAGEKTVKELREDAKAFGITGYSGMNKGELTDAISNYHAENEGV